MNVDRRLVIADSVLATVALLVVGLDVPSVLAGLVVLAFLLLGPGFSMTLLMGPMGVEARALASIAGSVALGTLVAVAMSTAGAWSALAGVAVLAAFTQICVIAALRRRLVVTDLGSGRLDGVPASPDDPPRGKETTHG